MTTRLHTATANRIRVETLWCVSMVHSFPLASGTGTRAGFHLTCREPLAICLGWERSAPARSPGRSRLGEPTAAVPERGNAATPGRAGPRRMGTPPYQCRRALSQGMLLVTFYREQEECHGEENPSKNCSLFSMACSGTRREEAALQAGRAGYERSWAVWQALERVRIPLGPCGATRARCVGCTVPLCDGEYHRPASADGGRAAGGAVSRAYGA